MMFAGFVAAANEGGGRRRVHDNVDSYHPKSRGPHGERCYFGPRSGLYYYSAYTGGKVYLN
eukprot:7384425-Prymnesium_polylepis.1